MNSWITMHWSHPLVDDLPWFLYRKRLTRLDDEVAIGDNILFFECKRPRNMEFAIKVQNGVYVPKLKLGEGAGGLVRCGKVSGARREIQASDILYDYGALAEWKYLTPCQTTGTGLVKLRAIHEVLGSRIPPTAFGLKKISYEEFLEFQRSLRD